MTASDKNIMYFSCPPTIFQPINLRSGFKYQQLFCHCFTTFEKIWVCRELAKNLPVGSSMGNKSLKDLCLRHNLMEEIVTLWRQEYQSTGTCKSDDYEDDSSALLLDEESLSILKNHVASAGTEDISEENFEKIVRDEFPKTVARDILRSHFV
jgi:hypothetical protein